MLSVVMPAYNEQEIIESAVREWYEEVVSRIPGCELIVVNDCSTDKTGGVLAALTRELPALRPLTTPTNSGHGKAVRYGFEHVAHSWVFQTDSDRQHLPSDFWRLWEQREGSDFVLGVRNIRADGAVRVVITNIMKVTNLLVWGVWIRDANCPFKLMRSEPLQDMLSRIPQTSFIPMVMVSILCRKRNYRVTEVVVQHLPRRGGEQSLKGIWKWIKVGSRCMYQLLTWRVSLLRNP